MFCAHSKKRRKRKRERRAWPHHPHPPSPPPAAPGGNIIPADESLAGLFHIYSSAAEFMIIVLKPWQRALCPGRLCAFVIPSALYSSLLPGEVQILAEEPIFLMVETKTKIPHLLTPRHEGGGVCKGRAHPWS